MVWFLVNNLLLPLIQELVLEMDDNSDFYEKLEKEFNKHQ